LPFPFDHDDVAPTLYQPTNQTPIRTEVAFARAVVQLCFVLMCPFAAGQLVEVLQEHAPGWARDEETQDLLVMGLVRRFVHFFVLLPSYSGCGSRIFLLIAASLSSSFSTQRCQRT
jgi:hypothetical protein